MNYAGFWLRVVACVIDLIIVSLVSGLLIALFGLTNSHSSSDTEAVNIAFYDFTYEWIDFSNTLLSLFLEFVYAAALESSKFQATVGKIITGIKVADQTGKRISFGRATARHFSKFLSALILGFGFLMVAWTQKKQGLHDKIAETIVIKSA